MHCVLYFRTQNMDLVIHQFGSKLYKFFGHPSSFLGAYTCTCNICHCSHVHKANVAMLTIEVPPRQKNLKSLSACSHSYDYFMESTKNILKIKTVKSTCFWNSSASIANLFLLEQGINVMSQMEHLLERPLAAVLQARSVMTFKSTKLTYWVALQLSSFL